MEEMMEDEILEMVGDQGFAHLALARGDDAYAIPIFYAFDGKTFFFHSHHGTKEDYLEKTGEACLVVAWVDDPQTWASVQVFGPVRKLEDGAALERAEEALLNVPAPPDMGTTETGQPRRTVEKTFVWTLEPYSMTGRKSAANRSRPDPAAS